MGFMETISFFSELGGNWLVWKVKYIFEYLFWRKNLFYINIVEDKDREFESKS